ncbi:MAG: hypothetical protein K9G27_06410 [Sphingomonadaceae bacterium]|nr:hypothetical protein [Sphingomonadaceae bacterium]
MTKGKANEKAPPPAKLIKALTTLLKQYEEDVIKDALKQLTKKKVGPRTIPDWELLAGLLHEDAARLLGRSSAARTSNRSTAIKLAPQAQRQSLDSAQRRLKDKLGKHREHYALVTAAAVAAVEEPVLKYLELCEELADGIQSRRYWQQTLRHAKWAVDAYRAKGKEISESMSYQDILAGLISSGTGSGFGLQGYLPIPPNE